MGKVKIKEMTLNRPEAYRMENFQNQFGFQPAIITCPQTTVSMNQPYEFEPQPVIVKLPSSHTALAWFTFLCCCWPLGIISLVKSRQVKKSIKRGDIDAAVAVSHETKVSSIFIMFVGTVLWIAIALYLLRTMLWE